MGTITSVRFLKRWLWDSQARILLGVALSLALGWLAVHGMDWSLVLEQFQDFPVGWALASLLLAVLVIFIRAYRWRLLFVNQKIPYMRLFMVQNAGLGLNNLMPVRVVGEGAQYALLTLRYKVNGGVALGAIGVERILDLVVTASLLMVGLTLLPNKGDFLPYVVGAFVVAVGSIMAVPVFIWLGRKPFVSKIPLLASTAAFLSDLTKAKGTLAYTSLVTLVHWLLIGMTAWVLAYGMDVGISPFVATITILGTLYFATSLPALPASVGTFEFAVVYVLKVFDVPQATAFSYGIVLHAIIFVPPIVLAIAYFSSVGLKTLKRREPADLLEYSKTPSPIAEQRVAE